MTATPLEQAQDHHRDACLDNHDEKNCAVIKFANTLIITRTVVQEETYVAPGYVWARISNRLGWTDDNILDDWIVSALNDPRVKPHSYIVYPTGYDDCTFTDKTSYCLTVTDGHAWGWKITEGLAANWSPEQAMNRKGQFIMESRGSGSNKFRRYPLEEALELALKYVDTITIMGRTLHEAQAWVDERS